jgi:hypothetical protein
MSDATREEELRSAIELLEQHHLHAAAKVLERDLKPRTGHIVNVSMSAPPPTVIPVPVYVDRDGRRWR